MKDCLYTQKTENPTKKNFIQDESCFSDTHAGKYINFCYKIKSPNQTILSNLVKSCNYDGFKAFCPRKIIITNS